jgi:hypothetical protein
MSTENAYVGGDMTSLAPKVAGYVTAVEVDDNQTVQGGVMCCSGSTVGNTAHGLRKAWPMSKPQQLTSLVSMRKPTFSMPKFGRPKLNGIGTEGRWALPVRKEQMTPAAAIEFLPGALRLGEAVGDGEDDGRVMA